jgi:hypothetical protein
MKHDLGKATSWVPQPGSDERKHGQQLDAKKNSSHERAGPHGKQRDGNASTECTEGDDHRRRSRHQIAEIGRNRLREKRGGRAGGNRPNRQTRKARPRTKNRAHAHIIATGIRISRPQFGIDDRPYDGYADAANEHSRRAGARMQQHVGTDSVDRKYRRQARQGQ